MYSNILKSRLRSRFVREEDGSASIEAAIMVPVMFLCVLTFITLIDYTRMHSMHQKAAYTISDMISRQTLALDDDYLAGTNALLNTLTRSPQTSTVRVTIVSYDADSDTFQMDWSKTSGYATERTASEVSGWTDRLPAMVDNERMIVVETAALYEPPFNVGLGNQHIENFIFTRPRYAPQVLWEDLETDFAGS
jgi:Flp pilus assembly protein TadG